jgi:hypothetical protein
MNVEETVLDGLKKLPLVKQKEVLDFINFLHHKSEKKPEYKSLYGFWSNYTANITDNDIKEIRKEMWADFPRGDI